MRTVHTGALSCKLGLCGSLARILRARFNPSSEGAPYHSARVGKAPGGVGGFFENNAPKPLTAEKSGGNIKPIYKPLTGRKRVTDYERVGGGVMPAETEPDNMGPGGPRRKATSSRGRNARVRSLAVLAADEWVRQQCRINAGWHRRVKRLCPRQQSLLSGFLFSARQSERKTRTVFHGNLSAKARRINYGGKFL